MLKKKSLLVIVFIIILNGVFLFGYNEFYHKTLGVQFSVTSKDKSELQLFNADKTSSFNEANSKRFQIPKNNEKIAVVTKIRYGIDNYLRLDFDETKGTVSEIEGFEYFKYESRKSAQQSLNHNLVANQCSYELVGEKLVVKSEAGDPYIVIQVDQQSSEQVMNSNTGMNLIIMVGGCIGITIFVLLMVSILKKNKFAKDLINNRVLIWNLSKNDFKTKYAGSFFGVLWAFVQPVVTIILYWFVFQVGFRSGDVGNFPFVLWLIVGLVPWFFFQDAISAGTNCLIEYSYLVKKMVFRVEILPFVKIISALFVHLFFIGFTFIVFAANGYFPTLFSIQILYYLFCSIALITALSFITSCIMVFFKDLGQIIQIVLQIGMWMTPIMWNKEMIPVSMHWLLEMNPMYYIVDGFRDSFVNHIWFWEKLDITLNFWLLVIFLFSLGVYLFKKLKVHFADVL